MNIVTVRNNYPRRYVEIIRSQIASFHPDVRFICLQDEDLRMNYPGWWAKMELFAPWNAGLRPFLYFDLDLFVLQDISDMLNDPGEQFQAIPDFYNQKAVNSSVMIIPKATTVWDAWDIELAEKHKVGGDQEFVLPFVEKKLIYPGIKSYKAHKLQVSPGDARVVVFHGKPKPPECEGWAKDIWLNHPRT